jgi:phage terminase small subunit
MEETVFATAAGHPLTDKEWAIIGKYFELGFNGTKAAVAAGYSKKSARQIASETLSKPYIREEIKHRMKDFAMGQEEVIARLSQHGRGDMRDFINKSSRALVNHPDGNLIKKFKRTVTTTVIAEDKSQTEEKIELELYDAQAALVQLGRIQGLFADRLDLTSDGQPIAILRTQMSLDEL